MHAFRAHPCGVCQPGAGTVCRGGSQAQERAAGAGSAWCRCAGPGVGVSRQQPGSREGCRSWLGL
eukprot:303492-Chlamydomonas_euryale.AAC.1